MNKVTTLQQAIQHFANYENCHEFMTKLRWPEGKVICPRCGSEDVDFLPNARVFKCYQKHERAKFSLKVGTVFEDSPLGLDKWLPVIWMLVNCKNGVSSWEIHRALGVTQKTAWFMLQRGRLALQQPNADRKLSGEVEGDETLVGGKVQNMHRGSKRLARANTDRNWGKTVVLGLLEREGKVRAAVAPSRKKHHVRPNVLENVEPGSKLYTDEHASYEGMDAMFTREFVNHNVAYVQGRVHTNGLENFWSLLKRSLKGTYVSVDPAHLQRYVDEQCFRFNNRENMNDADRFETAMQQIVGKRLTYKELIGANADASATDAPTHV
jgi:transposase-like protein